MNRNLTGKPAGRGGCSPSPSGVTVAPFARAPAYGIARRWTHSTGQVGLCQDHLYRRELRLQEGTMSDICVKAGKQAYEIIQDGGSIMDRISTYFGPAVGPRWLIGAGFDLTLMREGVLGRQKPVLLVGASAGAWRFAAWLQPEPEKSYRSLMEEYSTIVYTRADTPVTVRASLARVIDAYLEDDALPFALDNKRYRLAVITARGKNLVASEKWLIQKIGVGLCFLLNAANRSFLFSFAERIVFYSGAKPPSFCLRKDFCGRSVPLNEVNFKAAVLASGAIPIVVAGVRDIYAAPYGVYRDGGLIDYNLTIDYHSGPDDLVLFFHHQERIIPGWLDKKLAYRLPPADALKNCLMVYPSAEFVARLPQGKVPERDDFIVFMNDPSKRIENWQRAIAMSAALGEQFLELVQSGKLRDVIQPM